MSTSDDVLGSPVDGKVMFLGEVACDKNCQMPLMEQIKGIRYKLDHFLGFNPIGKVDDEVSFFYCTLYLAPGSPLQIHSPSWQR
jgi:phosphatidylserine decarboxylase